VWRCVKLLQKYGDLMFFSFRNVRFEKFEILMVNALKRANMCHLAKFHEDR